MRRSKIKFLLDGAVGIAAASTLAFAIAGAASAGSTSNEEDHASDVGATQQATAATQEDENTAAHGTGSAHWTYGGNSGPESWGRMSRDFRLCEAGTMQSPINIDASDSPGASIHPIKFDYHPVPLSIVHNGHTVQVNYAPGSTITVGGKTYELLQFHFHTPSEHAVKGHRVPMEVHFVHKNERGELAVVGVLLESGEENIVLREIWNHMPKGQSAEKAYDDVVINARDLLPGDQGYFRYMGSLTTPPCSEGVNWYVMETPISVGIDQIAQFDHAVGKNARPLQALNNRMVLEPITSN